MAFTSQSKSKSKETKKESNVDCLGENKKRSNGANDDPMCPCLQCHTKVAAEFAKIYGFLSSTVE